MSNKTEFHKKFNEEYSKRGFDPNDTIRWLSINKSIIWSWRYQNPTALKKDEIITGLMFDVNGYHHKGLVLITLAWNDTYTVRFFSKDFKENKEKLTDVYCDELQEKIDAIVEKIKSYQY